MDSLRGKSLPVVCIALLLSSVNGSKPNCTGIRLFNTNLERQASEGRVEILCNRQWGTICSNDAIIDSVICQQLGFGKNWRPIRTEEFGEGYGTVWDVQCSGKETTIQECSITETEPAESYSFLGIEPGNFSFWDHDKDIGVKCEGHDLSQDGNMTKESDGTPTTKKQDGIQSAGEQTNCKKNNDKISRMIIVVVFGFALLFATIVVCGFLIHKRFANLYASKENDQPDSQVMLPRSSHVTVQAVTISQDVVEESRQVETELRDSLGPVLTEMNPVYEPFSH